MRSSIRSATRGRPNKVTKPKRLSRPSHLIGDALESLADNRTGSDDPAKNSSSAEAAVAALVRADTELDVDQESDASETDSPSPNSADPSLNLPPSAALASGGLLTNGQVPPGVPDPSIHPDLQALGVSAPYPIDSTLDDTMQGGGHPPGGEPRTAAAMARDSGYDQLDLESTASTLSKRLAPHQGRRLAIQRRKEQQLNLIRRSNVEALLAHVSGQRAASSCKNCHKGHGPWTECVVVEGQMCGSCANCWYNASGARCSFHETNNPQAHQPAVLPTPTVSNTLGFGVLPPSLASSGSLALSHTAHLDSITDREAKGIVDKAFQEVKDINRRTRLLMQIEADAKRLALSIREYEEYMQTPEGQQIAQSELAAHDMRPHTGSAHGDISMEGADAPAQSDAQADVSTDAL